MSPPSVFVPALPVTASAAGEAGDKGRQSETEPGRSRRREGGSGAEGGGTATRVLFIEGCFFLPWKFPPAVP